MSESLYWTWLSQKLGAASPYLAPLLAKYASPKEIFDASASEISQIEQIPDALRQRLTDKDTGRAEQILADCRALGVGILTYNDPRYPRILKYIPKPPALLYFLGQPVDFDKQLCVAMVGTRTMSPYGRDMAYRFGYELASAGAVVVSGMALGVDGMSLAGALDAHMPTVAVLGSGVDVVYPYAHKKLYNAILHEGMVLSEYPPGSEPDKANFPQRNRIISGLCRCTLVVESPKSGGALITGRYSIAVGRPTFAVPGALTFENSVGSNELLKNGARIATSAEDILRLYAEDTFPDIDICAIGHKEYNAEKAANRYGVAYKKTKNKFVFLGVRKQKPKADEADVAEASALGMENETAEKKEFALLSPAEKSVFDLLPEEGGVSVDFLVQSSGESVADVSMHLLSLQIKGAVLELPGGRYRKA